MKIEKIYVFICALWLLSYSCASAMAHHSADSVVQVKGIQFVATDAKASGNWRKNEMLFSGVSASVDVAGAAMASISAWGQYEAALRVGIKNKFFPIVELGWGVSDHTSESTELHYKTNAPYFRVGCDYNFIKNPQLRSRLLGGVRYAYSNFEFDLDGPAIIDPVYGTSTAFHFNGLNSKVHWAEVVFGLDTRIWTIFHLGWSVRYKFRLSEKHPEVGSAWYVPGYGKNGGSCLGGTFNVIIDI